MEGKGDGGSRGSGEGRFEAEVGKTCEMEERVGAEGGRSAIKLVGAEGKATYRPSSSALTPRLSPSSSHFSTATPSPLELAQEP